MELFKIERYVGDSQSTENNAENESFNLAQLLAQARGRKRLRERSKQKDEVTISDERNESVLKESPKAKKTKKNKKEKSTRIKFVSKENSPENEDESAILLEKSRTSLSNGGIGNKFEQAEPEKDQDCLKETNNKTLSNRETSKEIVGEETLNPQREMTMIGGKNKKQRTSAVKRKLPKWLANPTFFSSNVNKNLVAVTEIKGLHFDLVKKLGKHGVKHFFPVQKLVIPTILFSWDKNSPFGRGGFTPQDICVCAPTGSGKTLTYVLPVIELLRNNVVRRLEALVVVPTKDLATQVWNVFNMYAQGTGLNVGLVNGLKSLGKEQGLLGANSSLGYSSYVNILVATPGRLVEHISSTEGFSLLYLRFFIIDEADRLLAEPYFGWLDKVYGSVFSSAGTQEDGRSSLEKLTPFWIEKIQRPLQKLLFSATLTQNPEKLALLKLYKPKFFTVSTSENDQSGVEVKDAEDEEFGTVLTTPETLEESFYICNSGGKPLVLLHLLTKQGLNGVLCFTSSVESTHRLYLLVKHFGDIGVQEFSSNLSVARRQTILNDFMCGQTQIIICSDAMARGLDVPAVKFVISYDPPVSSKTYVHRVGRTARAGKTGTAITLLHDNEVFHFKKMLKPLKKGKISKNSVKDGALEALMERYESALEKLKNDMTSKKQIKHTRK